MDKLREHQQKALEKLGNGKILIGGTGSGKSRVAMAYYAQQEAPKTLYVITTAKKRDSLDWDGEGLIFDVSTHEDSVANGLMFVDSWNNLGKYVDIEGAFFIFDEQRLVGTGAWTKAFYKIAKRNNWILLSATPGDTWLDYIPVFVANGFYKNITEFKREHVIYNTYTKFPKVDRYVGAGKLVRLRNQILVPMPFERHTVQHSRTINVDYDVDLMTKVVKDRWHVYENRPLRDVSELFSVMRKIVNSDSRRLDVVSDLMSVHPRLIVFYNFDYELMALRSHLQKSNCNKSPKLTDKSEKDSKETKLWTVKIPSSATTTFLTSNKDSPSADTASHLSAKPTCSSEATTTMFELPEFSPTLEGTELCPSVPIPRPADTALSTTSFSSTETPSASVLAATPPSARSISSRDRDTSTTSTTTSGSSPTSNVAVAEWNGHKHEKIPDTDRWVYLVQYVAGAEGWNCISTDTVVFFSQTYSYKNFHQAHGRIDRMNTPFRDLYYYSLISNSVIDQAIRKCLAGKRSFNENMMGEKWG